MDVLTELLGRMGRVLLGYSGGVDSAFLGVLTRQALGKEQFLAVIGRSASYPEAQWQIARDIAVRFDLPMLEVATHEMEDAQYRANPVNRCYFCKAELWRQLAAVATERHFDTVIDGTNADDLHDHRPGLVAGLERGIRSPLAELGWGKERIRSAARDLGIPIWDAPAAPCLSSRIQYGLAITPDRLQQVEAAEAFLRGIGVQGDLRVRHRGEDGARLEVGPGQFSRVDEAWPTILEHFHGLGFGQVVRDPRGYRRGALLQVFEPGNG